MIFPFSFLKRVALMSANDVPYIQSSMPRAEMSFIAITFTKTGIKRTFPRSFAIVVHQSQCLRPEVAYPAEAQWSLARARGVPASGNTSSTVRDTYYGLSEALITTLVPGSKHSWKRGSK